jgi:hypothetical protein
MKLLENINTPSFSRTIWVNSKAKEKWTPVISKVSQFVQELEVESVVENERPCTWQTISEEGAPLAVEKWARQGLISLPVRRVGNFEGFAHQHTSPVAGKSGSVCYVVSKSMDLCLLFKDAFLKNDHLTQGNLLGFPECCTTFFENTWKVGYFDPMWQSACNTKGVVLQGCNATVDGHPFSNPLLRYIGVRVGFHIPCSFDCEATVKIAENRIALGDRLDKDLVTLLLALINMPMKWDVLHGICVVKTPIFYIVAQSVPTVDRYVVETNGLFIPREV